MGWSPIQRASFLAVFQQALRERLTQSVVRLSEGVRFQILGVERHTDHVVVKLQGHDAQHAVAIDLTFTPTCKLYDLAVQDALLSRQYRGQFNRVLRQEGFAGLMAKLRNSIEQGGNYARASTVE